MARRPSLNRSDCLRPTRSEPASVTTTDANTSNPSLNYPHETALGRQRPGQFADLARVSGGTLAGDGHGCVIVGGLDDPEADDDFLGFDVGAVGHEAALHDAAGLLQSVASGHNSRAELLHPCVPGLLQSRWDRRTGRWTAYRRD